MWTWFAIGRDTPTVRKFRAKAELDASRSHEDGYRVRFEYLNAWLHGTRLRSALAACGYGILTLWFAGVLLRG